jgi:predicted DNA-binding protein (UPF0251 family)
VTMEKRPIISKMNCWMPQTFQVFRNEEKERLKIVGMRQCDAERMGIDRKTRWRMKRNRRWRITDNLHYTWNLSGSPGSTWKKCVKGGYY